MIDPGIYRYLALAAQRHWPKRASWIRVLGVPLISAAVLVVPSALLEILPATDDKIWAACLCFVIAYAVLVPIFMAIDASLSPIIIPNKPTVHIFLPFNDGDTAGDMLLQYAGFLAAEERFQNEITFRYHDSAEANWIEGLQNTIARCEPNEPLWLIVTMSSKGQEARHKIELMVEKDPRLRERLTVIFTVDSSSFQTADRQCEI